MLPKSYLSVLIRFQIGLNKEPEILAIRDGRFNKWRHNIQEDEASLEKVIEHRGYLRLPPRKLVEKQIITKEIFNKVGFESVYHALILITSVQMHDIHCPVPFIRMEKMKFSTYKDAYVFLGHSEDFSHPGHSPDITSSSQPLIEPDIDIHSQSLYKKDSAKAHQSEQNVTAPKSTRSFIIWLVRGNRGATSMR